MCSSMGHGRPVTGLHGVKDANDAAFAAIIAHIPREDWLSVGWGTCCNGHGESRQRHERFGRALKSWC
jgi:hypothetical protein